jgi:hypothetical protein
MEEAKRRKPQRHERVRFPNLNPIFGAVEWTITDVSLWNVYLWSEQLQQRMKVKLGVFHGLDPAWIE